MLLSLPVVLDCFLFFFSAHRHQSGRRRHHRRAGRVVLAGRADTAVSGDAGHRPLSARGREAAGQLPSPKPERPGARLGPGCSVRGSDLRSSTGLLRENSLPSRAFAVASLPPLFGVLSDPTSFLIGPFWTALLVFCPAKEAGHSVRWCLEAHFTVLFNYACVISMSEKDMPSACSNILENPGDFTG